MSVVGGLVWPLADAEGGRANVRLASSSIWHRRIASGRTLVAIPLSWPYPRAPDEPESDPEKEEEEHNESNDPGLDPYLEGFGGAVFSVSGWVCKSSSRDPMFLNEGKRVLKITCIEDDEDVVFLRDAEKRLYPDDSKIVDGNVAVSCPADDQLFVPGMFINVKLRISGLRETRNDLTGDVEEVEFFKTAVSVQEGWDWLPFSDPKEANAKLRQHMPARLWNKLLNELWLIVSSYANRKPTKAALAWLADKHTTDQKANQSFPFQPDQEPTSA